MAPRQSSSAAIAEVAAPDNMTVEQLMALLKEVDPKAKVQEAFRAPALAVVLPCLERTARYMRRQTVRCEARSALKVPHIEETHLERVLHLAREWKEDPMAFEREWSLHSSNVQRDGQEGDENASTLAQTPGMDDATQACHTWYVMLQKHISRMRKVDAEGQEVLMRRILCAVLFYDAVLAQSLRRKKDSGLPTGGMTALVTKVLRGTEPDQKKVEEVTEYVKLGYRCHLVGEAVGQGYWFLHPQEVLRIGDKYSVEDLRKAPELFTDLRKFVQDRPDISEAARMIREVQLRPFKPLQTVGSGERVSKPLMPLKHRNYTLDQVSSGPISQTRYYANSVPPPRKRRRNIRERGGARTQARSDQPPVTAGGCDRVSDAQGNSRQSSGTGLTAGLHSDTAPALPTMSLSGGTSPAAVADDSNNVFAGECSHALNMTGYSVDAIAGSSQVAARNTALGSGEGVCTLNMSALVNRFGFAETAVIPTASDTPDYRKAPPTATSLPLAPSNFVSMSSFPQGSPDSLSFGRAQNAHPLHQLTYAQSLTSFFNSAGLAAFGLS